MSPIYYTRYLYTPKGDCNLDKVEKHWSTLFNVVTMIVHQHCWKGPVYFYLRQTSKKARKRATILRSPEWNRAVGSRFYSRRCIFHRGDGKKGSLAFNLPGRYDPLPLRRRYQRGEERKGERENLFLYFGSDSGGVFRSCYDNIPSCRNSISTYTYIPTPLCRATIPMTLIALARSR